MNSVFGVLHHFQMRLQPDKNQKNRRQKVFRFYCWQHILAHMYILVTGVINEFCLRCFASLQMRLQPDKNQKNRRHGQKVSVFTASSIFWPIFRVMGVINEFGFRCFASFVDALTAR